MKTIWLTITCTLAFVVGCFSPLGVSNALAVASTPSNPRVTVVLAPFLTFADITPENTPALLRLADDGAIGAANVRARVRGMSGLPSPTESALSISSGAWTLPNALAGSAFVATETYERTGTTAAAYERVFGTGLGNARVAFIGQPATQRFNDLESQSTQIVLGTLGQSVEDAGGLTAAIGNSDVGNAGTGIVHERPAGVVAANMAGTVRYGDVSSDLLVTDMTAPFARRTDIARFRTEFERVSRLASAHAGPSLIVLDSGDLTRAEEFAAVATSATAAVQRTAALKTLDAVVGMASDGRGENDVVIVISQALGTDATGELQGLGPCVVAGGGLAGYLSSPSTHRAGIMTNLDVTATVLDQLGIERPVQALGNAMVSSPGPASATERVNHLTRMNQVATSVDGTKAGVLNVYIGFAVLVLAISGMVLARAPAWRPATARFVTGALMRAVLLLLSVPIASWLMFLVVRYPTSRVSAVLTLIGVSLVVWTVSLALWRRFSPRVPVIALTALTATVLLAEQFFGAPLSFVNYFGYSPLPAARFYGMGNEAASVLFGATLAGLALLLDQHPNAPWARKVRVYGIPVLGAVVVLVAAAPFLGANVAVAIWGAIGFALAWILMNGKRLTWPMVAAMFLGVVVLIGTFAAIDLFGGGEQTHLGRSLASAEQGGLEQLWTIVVRKAETNVRVFTRTNWSWVLVAVLLFLGFMRMRPTGDFADTLAENPRFADAITVTLVAGSIAFFTEDSGIVIPALIMLFTGTGVMWLMLMRLRERTEATA